MGLPSACLLVLACGACSFPTQVRLVPRTQVRGQKTARHTFSLGPRFDAYKTLRLDVKTAARWTAYVNDQLVATASGPFQVPANLLKASGNTLELKSPEAFDELSYELDGNPDAQASAGARIARGPWVVAPSPDGITVVWETSSTAPSFAVVDGRRFDGGEGTHHRARITGLQPSTAYDYHVEVGAQQSETAQLSTAAKPGERVRFVVYGDNRTHGDIHRRVVDAIEHAAPDFLFSTGDLVGHSAPDEWQKFFDIEFALLRKVPLFPSAGNHEYKGDGVSRYRELFPVAPGNTYYGADFGDVHVSALDSNSDLATQAAWLERDLTAAEQRGAKHLFIIMHHGPYSSGSSIAHGSNGDARRHIVPIAKRHRVDAVFAGHDHFYERGRSGELAYFVTGGGGAPLHSAGRIPETIVSRSVHHFLVVDVSGPTAAISAVDLNGQTFDKVELARN
jgi:acid phosphatase type 7